MNPILRTIDRGTRTVAGIEVQVTELIDSNIARSFEVHRTDTGADLTADGCLDTWPTDAEIADLLHDAARRWSCTSCGTTVLAGHADLIADHVRDCDQLTSADNRAPAAPARSAGGYLTGATREGATP